MKKTQLLLIMICMSFGINAQNISLPKPLMDGKVDALKAINTRQSDRSFKDGDISMQDLATILQAGFGYSHCEKRTAPTAMNSQDIDLYVFLESGIYLWNAKNNELVLIKKGDYRNKTDRDNGFASKVTNIAIVSDLNKFRMKDNNRTANIFGAMSAAYVSENIYIAIASTDNNIGTVVRYTAKEEKQLREIIKLKDSQVIFLFQTIGYKK